MFRASRPLARIAARAPLAAPPPPRILPRANAAAFASQLGKLAVVSSSAPRLVRFYASQPPPNRGADKDVAQETIEPRPDQVSASSSTRAVLEPSSSRRSAPIGDGTDGLKHDIEVVKDTFRLSAVPRESHILGLAGTIPYMATSVSTVFLAWSVTKEVPTGNSLYDSIVVNHETAEHLLGIIEPIQLGYGAVIISFLGAIHWGLEYAEKKPLRQRTRFRYGIGVAASIMAWPTLYLPLEYALTTQFMAFLALYFADARAVALGWAPAWYATYRWLLTAMVGLAILVSLVGRAKIGQQGQLSSQGLSSKLSQPGLADRETDWGKVEAKEKERLKKEREAKAKEEREAKAKDKGKGDKKDEKDKEAPKTAEKTEEDDSNDNGKDDESKDDSKDKDNDSSDE